MSLISSIKYLLNIGKWLEAGSVNSESKGFELNGVSPSNSLSKLKGFGSADGALFLRFQLSPAGLVIDFSETSQTHMLTGLLGGQLGF
jgi:hypothetical protein